MRGWAKLASVAGGCMLLASAAWGQGQTEAMQNLNALNQALGAGVPGAPGCSMMERSVPDQMVLLHTQLMITSLACAEVYGDPALHNRYLEFTNIHADALMWARSEIEQRLGSTAAFDTYRSELANAESQVTIDRTIGRYCMMRQSRFNTLMSANPRQFEGYAEEVAARAGARLSC